MNADEKIVWALNYFAHEILDTVELSDGPATRAVAEKALSTMRLTIESLQAQFSGKNSIIDVNKSLLDAAVVETKRLNQELEASQRREKAAVELAGKLIALCDVPKEWRDKLFRRHVNRPGVYMGSGYDFLDGFYRLFDDFSETADEETYRSVRLVAEKEFEWRGPQEAGEVQHDE